MRLLRFAILAVFAGWIGFGVYVHFVGGSDHTVAVWIASHDVAAGVAVDATVVRQEDEPADVARVGLRSASPIGQGLVFAHGLQAGDMLRDDDVVSATATADVAITFKKAAGIQAGDHIDIYLATTGSTSTLSGVVAGAPGTQLLGRGILVVSGGLDAEIAVPTWEEPLWTAIAASDKALYAERSSGIGVPASGQVYSADSAVTVLGCVAAAPAGTQPPCAGGPSTIGAVQPSGKPGG